MSRISQFGTAASAEYLATNKLSLQMRVDDAHVREDNNGFDGMEQVFAIVPMKDGSWERFAMGYSGDRVDRSGRREDLHKRTVTADDGVDFDKVQKEGIAFGMETNVGTLYVQRFGDNYRPWPLD